MGKQATGLTRRKFGILCARAMAGGAVFLSGCSSLFRPKFEERIPINCENEPLASEYDYIVVGSGAGGGPLAANLARKGYTVLLMEAGGDNHGDVYDVPLFNPQASEDPGMRWDFFVRHYANPELSRQDEKFQESQGGVYYPRSGTLGGCTAHNAMIMIYPDNSDWDYIARVTGDSSWHSSQMRRYFERLEACQYVEAPESKQAKLSRHGFRGWLPTSIPGKDVIRDLIASAIRDDQLKNGIFKSMIDVLYPKMEGHPLKFLKKLLEIRHKLWMIDPNDARKNGAMGLFLMPLTTLNGRRTGSREYVRQVEKTCGGRLTVKLHALVTRVIFEGNTAVGVEYMSGERLYRADRSKTNIGQPAALCLPRDGSATGDQKCRVQASREVILSGGAFNTPQLLMLSGIGPKKDLQEYNIPVQVNSPWVGQNLQDRYEVGLVSNMKNDFDLLRNATFKSPKSGEKPDALYQEWEKGKGLYTTNGGLISFVTKSKGRNEEDPPDLFIFGMPGNFKGYYPGYSVDATADKRHFTWAILKAHTHNTGGRVRLKSSDPRDVPAINFHYFDEGTDTEGRDLAAVVDGVKLVRRITERAKDYIASEEVPGDQVQSDEQIKAFIKANAWGHHASCSCKMGPADPNLAVVDSRFRVNGVKNLRIVDASVFPKIPGYFIVSAVYMISEKAFEVIHEDALSAISASHT